MGTVTVETPPQLKVTVIKPLAQSEAVPVTRMEVGDVAVVGPRPTTDVMVMEQAMGGILLG
jgi:hypothetical protein